MTMKRSSKGFTLIEVLIAVLILSVGLLGVAGTLVTAAHSASSNYLKQQGVQYAYGIVDRMHSNPHAADNPTSSNNPYVVSLTAPAATIANDCTSASCTQAQMAAYDVWQWQTELKNNLPNGLGSVAVTGGGSDGKTAIVTVTVQWSDQPASSATAATTNSHYTVVTGL
jgi:type IV pilus assembly protein PilV